MKLQIECYRALCELSEFKINGIQAEYEDFGNKEDIEPENAEPYGCGNMKFTAKEPTQQVLDKYKITKEEYDEICEKLDCLSFGTCGWCV